MDLTRKIDFALSLLNSIPQDGPIESCYSGGKDSDVILELAKMSGIPFEAIYKNTTIDPPGTIQHCKDMGVRIVKPRKTFLQIVEEKGMPSRFSRFCCADLKEYKIHDRAIQGIRRCESTARAKRYKEPEFCRTYSKTEKVRIYLPILEWSNQDVKDFIEDRGIKCAPVYYDFAGNFHVERRLGCIGCPMATDNGIGAFLQYPKLLKAIIRAEQKYIDSRPDSNLAKWFKGNAYNAIFKRFFCHTMEDYQTYITGGLFPDNVIDAEKTIKNLFSI